MSDKFPVIIVVMSGNDDETETDEAIGSKFKFWCEVPQLGNCLYKRARENTGEDWSEKIASELCELLGLPYAIIELAGWQDTAGTVSPSFVPAEGLLVPGNDILVREYPDYPKWATYRVSEHTIDVVLAVIDSKDVKLPLDWTPPDGIATAVETFVGYLMLDAWIGNSDRHHENWGFVQKIIASSKAREETYLAPTYDHASSLGRELTDAKRRERLNNNSVSAYATKCRSALYARVEDKKAMRPLDAFREAAQRYPNAALVWLERLSGISPANILALFERLPENRISDIAAEFAREILEINQSRLLKLQEELR